MTHIIVKCIDKLVKVKRLPQIIFGMYIFNLI